MTQTSASMPLSSEEIRFTLGAELALGQADLEFWQPDPRPAAGTLELESGARAAPVTGAQP